ncbi:sugar kinase [Acrocarpospora pleiomorpha]|uniref:Sugar kinase n=1 Tax=Acrocarpospora pleiomorpha TaxID=90975 RepID=A0A5M3XL03_9ACTN|nr:FGGY family carbohydrate kinase [Acrocarpospora pleiomorpha]GES21572.1 sugar kinase [Acrocarpospora pleiomorpha]
MSDDLVLGLDIGTSSSKAVLCDSGGRVVRRAEREHHTSRPAAGHVEHDADRVWWDDVLRLTAELGDLDRVAAVCVSGIGPCLLVTDEAGTPLRPAILYGVDTRAARQIADQERAFGAEKVLRRCGSGLTSQAVGPKMQWVRENEPHVWDRARRFFMASSFIAFRLSGAYVLDHHSASQAVPLYDANAQDWAADWAAEVAGGLELPALVWPGDIVGEVTAEAAAHTGLRTGVPVLAGTVDAWAEAYSVGVRAPGDCMIMYGTTMFLVAYADDVQPCPRLWTANGVDPGSRCAAAGMSAFGAVARWGAQTLAGGSYAELEAAAAGVPPGAAGLVVLPYWDGERTPIFDPDARGVIAGLGLEHGPGHVYRALLEGTALGVRHNLLTLREAGVSPERLVAVGGGARQRLWVRIVSDVTGAEQAIPGELVGAAYGDARLAAEAIGLADRRSTWARVRETVRPDPRNAELYAAMFDDYLDLYDRTGPLLHRLRDRADGVPQKGVR